MGQAGTFERCSVTKCEDPHDWFAWPADKKQVTKTISDGYVVKDTVVLPAGGYLVTRLIPDNPGHWMAHCHTDYHLADGMGIVLREGYGQDDQADYSWQMPESFPSCNTSTQEAYDGSYRDLLNKPYWCALLRCVYCSECMITNS